MREIIVHRTGSREEALVVTALLESSGITCETEEESAARLYGLTLNGLGEMRIFVPARHAEEAMALIAEELGEGTKRE